MKPKNQVANLRLCKKLKELGVKQKSIFQWHDGHVWYAQDVPSIGDDCSAFTVAELGEMMPHQIQSYKSKNMGQEKKGKWACQNDHTMACDSYTIDIFYAKTEADARAKMIIYLLEEEIINNKCVWDEKLWKRRNAIILQAFNEGIL